MLTPTIYFNLLMNIIGSWQVFTQVYIMTNGGPNNATLTMVLYLYRLGFINLRFGYASSWPGCYLPSSWSLPCSSCAHRRPGSL